MDGTLTDAVLDAWLAARRRGPDDGQRLGQAFLNSPLAAPMRAAGRVDPGLFYERDDAVALSLVRERYVGRDPADQGFGSDAAPRAR